jgi:hypothetical protein
MDAPQPPASGEGQWAPSQTPPIIFDTFNGLNTNASRPGIQDQEMAWCDGFIPLGKNNLRTLPGIGPAIYNAAGFLGVVWFAFGNIGATPYCIVFSNIGAVQATNMLTNVTVNILPPGSIVNPSSQNQGITQWGNQWIIITSNQPNGYWIWDGTSLFTAGTVAPLVSVVNGGANYTGQPTFTVQTTGTGHGVSFTSTIVNGSVELVTVTNPGTGFGVNDFTNVVTSGGGSDTQATGVATIGNGGGVVAITVLNPGDYTRDAVVVLSGGGGSGAVAAPNLLPQGSSGAFVQTITVLQPGTGYTAPPTVSITATSQFTAGLFVAQINTGDIVGASVTNPGSGYFEPPTVSVIGNGSGATLTAFINSGGSVTGVSVLNGGSGYTAALLNFSGGNNAASITLDLMPFGIKGSYPETYQSRVWVADGNQVHFTAAESTGDFSTSGGGGTFISTDSFLKNAYTALKQTNGFLYLLGDSSENYISGVTTSQPSSTSGSTAVTGPPVTTFNNQNADPEIGTSWPGTVSVFTRDLLFANPFGVHISYGGAVTKISEALDGIYNTVPNFGGFVPSSAKGIVFGKKIWMLLLPIIDPYTGQQVNKLLCWNGKLWFTSNQDVQLTYIAALEINSNITAYGTDGQKIYPLFNQPSTAFKKVVQSKLFEQPGGYMYEKATSRLWGVVNYYSSLSPELDVGIDNENGTAITNPVPTGPVGSGPIVFAPDAVGQSGALVGITLSTSAADMAIVSLSVQSDIQAYRG